MKLAIRLDHLGVHEEVDVPVAEFFSIIAIYVNIVTARDELRFLPFHFKLKCKYTHEAERSCRRRKYK